MSVVEAPTRREVSPVTREVTEADIYERAAYLLEEFGWHQGHWAEDVEGPFDANTDGAHGRICRAHSFCFAGALYRAKNDLNVLFTQGMVGARILDIAWNDAPGRTKAEVVAKLREAAANAR